MKSLLSLFLICCGLITCTPVQENSTEPIQVDSNENLQKSLLRGWNTWKNPSVLSHVLMPEGLGINFLFRKTRRGPYWLRDAYISSKRNAFPEILKPFEHAYDGSYTEMTVEWEGQSGLIRTASEGDHFVLHYQPAESPEKPHMLVLETSILWNKLGVLQRKDDMVHAQFGDKQLSIGVVGVENGIPLPLNTPHFNFWSNQEVALYVGKKQTMEGVKEMLDEKKQAQRTAFQKYGDLAEVYEAIQTLHAWNTIYDAKNDRAITPVSRVWNEAWGGYILFDWDTYFSAVMLALDQKELAYSNAIAITNAATDRGFIPNVETGFLKSNDRSQPPVGSMMCKMIYDKYKEPWFLEEVYDNLLSWNRWWDKARNNQGYLSWGSDPHPEGMEGNTKKAAKWESGLDNSPLFDEAVFNKETHMLEMASVGLMGLYVADCKDLATIAGVLGKTEDAIELKKRENQYATKLRELWDEETGIYRDKYLDSGEWSTHLAPTNFYPMIAGIPTQEQAERMIDEHFMNPGEFYGDWMLPSIARNDPGFPDNSYWRGRVWAPMNFLVYLGLRNYDLPEARKILVDRSLKLILKSWREHKSVHENYNSTTGVGKDVRNSSSFYSWGGLLGFIALMEEGYY